MNFFQKLSSRGLIHSHTPNVDAYLNDCKAKSESPLVYAGFDPSGISLQIGNLSPVFLLRQAQLHGVKPIILLGGATGLVGDPSGKKAERNLMEVEKSLENIDRIKAQLSQFIDFSPGKYQAQFVNNADWFSKFNYVEFLRDVGKYITVNYMLAKDSVKLRMETGISYAEFGYMLMQGYDFMHLYEKLGARIQVGGSDQWGNITTGIELIRRKHQAEAHAISTPLLTDANGNKLGKTEDGAIFLDPTLTSPFKFYQYLLGRADSEVLQLLRALTMIETSEIESIAEGMKVNPEGRVAQNRLAEDLTEWIHGTSAKVSVKKASQVLFSKDPESLLELDPQSLKALAEEIPATVTSSVSDYNLLDLLVQSKLASSKSEARRHVQGGAIHINRKKVTDEKHKLDQDDFNKLGFSLLGFGKTQLHLLLRKG